MRVAVADLIALKLDIRLRGLQNGFFRMSPEACFQLLQLTDSEGRYVVGFSNIENYPNDLRFFGLPIEVLSDAQGVELLAVSDLCEYCGARIFDMQCLNCGGRRLVPYRCVYCGSRRYTLYCEMCGKRN